MKKIVFTIVGFISATAGMSQSFHVPDGSTGITDSPNDNFGINMTPSLNTTLSLSSGAISPLEMISDDAIFKFWVGKLMLRAREGYSNVPYIEWRTSDFTRQAYLGWRADVFNLKLENGFNFLIDGGNVGIGTNSPPTESLTVNGSIHIPAATTTDDDSPAVTAKSDDDFLYDGEYINHYAFGFHKFDDGNGLASLNAYLAGYFGIDLFTNGINRRKPPRSCWKRWKN